MRASPHSRLTFWFTIARSWLTLLVASKVALVKDLFMVSGRRATQITTPLAPYFFQHPTNRTIFSGLSTSFIPPQPASSPLSPGSLHPTSAPLHLVLASSSHHAREPLAGRVRCCTEGEEDSQLLVYWQEIRRRPQLSSLRTSGGESVDKEES